MDEPHDLITGLSVYAAIANLVRERINDGTYPVGQRLPIENDLADQFGVSRVTVNRALRQLQEEGLLTVRRGVGVFVTEPERIPINELLETIITAVDSGSQLLLRRPDGTVRRIIF